MTRHHPVLRWVKRVVLGLLALVVVTVGGALAALHTDWGREQLRKIVVSQMTNTFTGGATIGRIEGSPFSELRVRQLVINGPDGKPAILIGTLHLRISLLPLISHDLQLDQVIADDVDVALKRAADGSLQIADLTKPGPPSTWNIALPDVQVHRGHVMFDTGAATTDVDKRWIDIDDLRIDAGAKLPNGGTTTATAILHAAVRQRAGAVVDIALTVKNDEGNLNLPAVLVSGGGAQVAIADLRMAKGSDSDPLLISGTVAANAPAAVVAQLVPGVELPDDIAAAVVFGPHGAPGTTGISLMAQVGPTPIRAFVLGDLAKRTGRGLIVTGDLDAGKLSHGKLAARGGAVIAFDAAAPVAAGQLPVANAMVTAWGALQGEPRIEASVGLNIDAEHVRAALGALTPGARVGLSADISKKGDALTLESAHLLAGARDPARISPVSPALYGSLHADLTAHGALSPSADLSIAGHLDGEHLKLADLEIASVQLQLDAHSLPSAPIGNGRLVIAGLTKGEDIALETLTIAATNLPDHRVQVGIRTRPRARPWLVDADAIITPPKGAAGTTIVELTHHHVRADGTDWSGSSGRFEIGPTGMSLHDLKTASLKGALDLDLDYTHTASTGHLTVAADAAVMHAGTAKLALDMSAPASIGDTAGWAHLTRAAIQKCELEVQSDLAAAASDANQVGLGITGSVTAKINVTPTDITGVIDVRKLMAPALETIGAITAHVDIAQKGATGDLTTQATAKIDGIGGLHFTATTATPSHPFDAAAWRALGRGAFKGAQVKLDELTLDPGLFDQLHIDSQLRGKLDLVLDIPPGLPSAKLAFAVHQLHGGPIAQPIEITLDALIDDQGTKGGFHVRTKQAELVTVDATIPLTLAALMADPAAALATPLHVVAQVPDSSAPQLLATFGRSDVTKGTIGGQITVDGTVGKPTVTANLTGTDLQVPPGLGAKQTQVMKKLALEASWDGTTGKVKITGDEASGGTLAITAQGSPRALPDATATFEAKKFDVRTLTAFAPGAVGAIVGQLDGKLTVKGADPRTMDVQGKLVFTAARLPIAPQIGTMRQANVQLSIENQVIKIEATGKLGHDGTVKLSAEAPLKDGAPTGGKATLTLRKVTPILAIQPVINSDITATISRKDDTWDAQVKVANTLVKIPDSSGNPLDPVGVPPDLVYGRRPKVVIVKQDPTQKPPPPHPLFVAHIDLGTVTVESSDARGALQGKLDFSLGEAQVGGSAIGIVGDVAAERGEVELFDRRYQIERAAVHFDGSTDPQLDVRITYDFPDVTTVTEVHGRLSKPQLALSSEPGLYSQGELLGFLLGGEPNGDTQQSQSAAARVSGAGTSLVANQIGGYVKKALPVSVDVIKYEAASDINSAAFTVGSWVTHTLFVAYKEHLEARPDENTGEGDVEYYIKPRLFLDGTVGDRGYDGLDLLWRKRW